MNIIRRSQAWFNSSCAVLMLLTGISVARADIHCGPSLVEFPSTEQTTILSGSFYAGNDLPVGSVIYMSVLQASKAAGISCDAPFSVDAQMQVVNEPSGSPFTQSGIPWSGQIYPTNVPGIGVALHVNGMTFTKGSPLNLPSYYKRTDAGGDVGIFWDGFFVALIKTGNVASGSVVNGNSIPDVIKVAVPAPGYTGLPVTTRTFHFSGNISFITQTCQTPDVFVDMGPYTSDDFPKVGSKSALKDVSIQLKNCPTFTGYHDRSNLQSLIDTGSPSGGTLAPNILEVFLAPTTDVANASDLTTFKLDGAGNSDVASGIGYQIGYSTNLNATDIDEVWHQGQVPFTVIPPVDGTTNFRIPVWVRYNRYGDLKSGRADGKIIFTINYK
ncbi:hypothetical protein MXF09_23510 [Klebsiella aerogenes]|uniref:fimbrial protein n=1 Tax=Klebsiella aerogenes TaxID=548 RepID=UPI002DBD8017|nr:hypothetical protein [Klebsiella aerogenes]MEB5742664.1 hypothetical protein [Klebsiella aerogenes]